MKSALLFVIGGACGAVLMALPKAAAHLHGALPGSYSHGQPGPGEARAHTKESFAFTANAPLEQMAPLFSAEKESVWAPDWNPQFVHPLPARDEEGMVFTVAREQTKSVWVNTELDEKNGRIQYAYVILDRLVTLITLKLTPQGEKTRVAVEYERTALSADADDRVRQLAEEDRAAGPAWEKQVNGHLERKGR